MLESALYPDHLMTSLCDVLCSMHLSSFLLPRSKHERKPSFCNFLPCSRHSLCITLITSWSYPNLSSLYFLIGMSITGYTIQNMQSDRISKNWHIWCLTFDLIRLRYPKYPIPMSISWKFSIEYMISNIWISQNDFLEKYNFYSHEYWII